MTKKQINLPIVIGLIILVGVVAFFSGIQYQKRQMRQTFGQGNFPRNGNMMVQGKGQAGTKMQNARPINGEIISADENSITIKLEDGSSKIVMISNSTQINKADQVDKSVLTSGQKVAVFGSDNNGTVTANMIQLNPMQLRRPDMPSTNSAVPE